MDRITVAGPCLGILTNATRYIILNAFPACKLFLSTIPANVHEAFLDNCFKVRNNFDGILKQIYPVFGTKMLCLELSTLVIDRNEVRHDRWNYFYFDGNVWKQLFNGWMDGWPKAGAIRNILFRAAR